MLDIKRPSINSDCGRPYTRQHPITSKQELYMKMGPLDFGTAPGKVWELWSKLLVSPLISPIEVPYIFPQIAPLFGVSTLNPKPYRLWLIRQPA